MVSEIQRDDRIVNQEQAEIKAQTGVIRELGERFQKSSSPTSVEKEAPKTQKTASAMGAYIFLLFLGIGSIFVRQYFSYDLLLSLLFSTIIATFFYLIVRSTPESKIKNPLILITLILEVMASQGLINLLPENELTNVLITIQVFSWLILSIIFFFLGLSEYLSTGKKVGPLSWIITILIIGTIIFLTYPYLIQNPYLSQIDAYDNYQIAQQELEKLSDFSAEATATWMDQLSCLSAYISSPGSVDQASCIKDKLIKRTCEKEYDSLEEINNCITAKKSNIALSGTIDSTIKEPTKAEFSINKDFFPFESTNQKTSYPITLKIENPRQEAFSVKVKCTFINKRNKKENITGIIKNAEFDVKESTLEKSFACTPEQELNQSYELVFQAELINMKTKSRISRAFIGEKTDTEKEILIPQIIQAHFPGRSYLSQAPEEFARINFAFGNPIENPIIESDSQIILSSSIENTGKGQITKVRHYVLGLAGFYAVGGDIEDCLEGSYVNTQTKQEIIYLPTCYLEMDSQLKDPEDYIFREFVAELDYDYLIEHKENIVVNPPINLNRVEAPLIS